VSAAQIEAMYPKWRDQIIGHSLRAGELTFTDCAALLEDMASGGYPHHTVGEDRVAVRIAIVARAAELLRAGSDLLAMTQRYASECGECNGTGVVQEFCDASASGSSHAYPGRDEPCPDCADIRALIAKPVKP
jgi:hypothetical protein